jgi:exopolyphosphatase/guanosine-5'-triphosphate,3'-diphosphate pyrophosphatase
VRGEARELLRPAVPTAGPGDRLVGLGGAVRALARIHLRLHAIRRRSRHGFRLRQSDVTALRECLEALPLTGRRHIPGLKLERADIIVAGAVVVEELMRLSGHPAVIVCERGVRDGVLLRETFNGET